MKKIILITIGIILIMTSVAWADEGGFSTDQIIASQIDQLDTSELQQIMNVIGQDLEGHLPSVDIRSLITQIIRGEGILSLREITQIVLAYLFREVLVNWRLLGQIIILAAIYAILSNLQSAFENESVAKLAYTVCYLVIISITIQTFMIAINLGRETITLMVTFMQALLPILLAILMAMGGVTTSAFFHPVLLASIGLIGTIIQNIVLPLIFFAAILTVVNNFTYKIQITKLASLLKQAAVVILGFILTTFVGIITIQGVTASTVDGITIRTAKFAVDKFIPIVGGFLSDAVDTVIGASLLLKNAVGAIGLLSIFLICLIPMIKILALVIIYKLSAAIIEPIAEKQLVDCLNGMSNALVLLFATVSSVAIMFFITITIIVGTGNITVMMR